MSKQPIQNDPEPGEVPDESKQEQYGTFRLDALGVSGGAMIDGPPKRRVPAQAVVLVALVVVAGGALYAMRRLGMGPMGAIAEVRIEYDYEKSRGTGADHKKLLADLTTSQVDQQVPADKVQKNPFKIPELHPEIVSRPTTPKAPGVDPEAVRREKIAAALATLKVHTVLSGAVPVARVGDENVRVGDKIAEYFVVTAIEGRSVDVMVDGQTYTLSIDDEIQGRAPRKGPAKKK